MGVGKCSLSNEAKQGGSEVKPPQRQGYGTTLIRELLTLELDGTVEHRYSPDGVTCEI